MRSLACLDSKNVDILIVDKMGSDCIEYCIPHWASFLVLPVRRSIPWVPKLSFIYRIFIRLLKFQSLREAIIFSIIDVLKPKILITFIDNSTLMGRIHNEFPKKLVISVQNGFRSGFKYPAGSFSAPLAA